MGEQSRAPVVYLLSAILTVGSRIVGRSVMIGPYKLSPKTAQNRSLSPFKQI
jgi:hypothetical protein